ncbi:Gfo/Idh/MocA family oxidoreductase [Prochlorococcus sp. MIT 1341]|uniref:Gfo/Idh/MocA family protein n=1 Tax=Prochlorococcus sp. MIT 1341 TaxID=3096221 RepID=UPI002A757AEC|nr:Gfo/Idh/MocA family oxidoreductase [Prochlorococcus sp. MIT 1341]
MKNEKKIRIGVIGLASIAKRSIIPEILSLPNHYKLSAISSRDIINTEKIAGEYGCKFFHDYKKLLNSNCIDAVYIPQPNSLHFKCAMCALENNVNVLLEKPFTTNYQEALELVGVAKRKKLAIFETFQFRFHSQLGSISEIIQTGQLGELRTIRSSFGFPLFNNTNNIRYQSSLGGGALLDVGCYTTKISQLLLGVGLSVKSSTLHTPKGYEVDMWGGAHLEEKGSGIVASLAFGFNNFYQCNLEIWGQKGKLSTSRIFTSPLDMKPTLHLEKESGSEKIELKKDNQFKNMLIYFYKLISDHKLKDIESLEILDNMRLLDEIRKLSKK